jgi:hypothetical protein
MKQDKVKKMEEAAVISVFCDKTTSSTGTLPGFPSR